jgi:putative copper resistance protein D
MTASYPTWVLAWMYWLHMLATVIWIGGLVTLNFLVLPVAHKVVTDAATYLALIERVQGRLQSLGWVALAVLVGTGLFQMSAHPSYQGVLVIQNTWSIAIFVKHLVIGLMVLLSIYLTWWVTPAMRRLAILLQAGREVDEAMRRRLQQRERMLLWVNMGLSILVLLLTAWARVS